MPSRLNASHSDSITSLLTLSMPSGSAIQKVSENFIPASANSVRMQFGGFDLRVLFPLGRNLDGELAGLSWIGVIVGSEIDLHQRVPVGVSPISDLLRHQIFVRDQEFAPVAGGNRNVSRLHGADAPGAVADGDEIAWFHRLIRKQDNSADEIGDDFLQAEADAD